jgi:hypothetical protein
MNQNHRRRGLTICAAICAVVVASVLDAGTAAAEEPAVTNAELSQRLLEEVLTPIADAADQDGGPAAIALRSAGATANAPSREALQEAIGNFFYDRGYEVWTPAAEGAMPDSSLVFEFEVHEAAIDYPRRVGGFLGFGSGKTLRRAVLGVEGRVRNNLSGRWVWRGAPRRQFEDWVPSSSLESLRGEEPAWVDAYPIVEPEAKTGWWERALVAGLLSSVVIVYFDGAN